MSQPVLLQSDQGPVRVLTLNRPQRLNALNEELKKALVAALEEAAARESVRVVVITGAGRAFSAGGDLERFAELYEAGDHERRLDFTHISFPRAFLEFPKPLIAAINGVAVGWGFTMPLMCDLRLASQRAEFSCGFVRVGLTPEFGSSALLPRMVGLGRAMELVLTARRFGAAEALEMGLVGEVVPPEELMPRALELAGELARLPAPGLRLAKRALHQGSRLGVEQVLGPEIELFRRAMSTPEHYRAVKAMQAALAGKKGHRND